MKSKMVLCDRAVARVPRQGAVLGQGSATRVKTAGCRKTSEPRHGGRHDTRAVLGLSWDSPKCARHVRTWQYRCPPVPLA